MMLYITSILILIRSVFRVIEYMTGMDSYLFKNEWPLYAFDAALMVVAMFIYGIFYPGNLNYKGQGTEAGMPLTGSSDTILAKHSRRNEYSSGGNSY